MHHVKYFPPQAIELNANINVYGRFTLGSPEVLVVAKNTSISTIRLN